MKCKQGARKMISAALATAVVLGGSLGSALTPAYGEGYSNAAPDMPAIRIPDEKTSSDQREARARLRKSLLEEAAAVLGMKEQELRSALKDKTLVELAKERGISEAKLVAGLKRERVKRIDEELAAGRLTKEQADEMKQKLDKRLSFLVHHKLGSMKKGMFPAMDKISRILGMSEEALRKELDSGKSLAEIAQSKGMSKEQLVSKLKEEMTPWLERMVEHKRSGKQ